MDQVTLSPTDTRPTHLCPKWVADLYDVPDSRKGLQVVISEVGFLVRIENFIALDSILSHLDLARLTPTYLMSFMRITAIAKRRLPSWQDVCNKVYAELNGRGLSADEIMTELLRKEL